MTSLETLVHSSAAPVYGLVRHLVGDAAAEEVTLDVWRELGTTGHGLAEEPTMAWVLAVAHRRAVEERRRSADPVPATTNGDDVRTECGTLTPVQREALLAAYFQAATCDEIGVSLGLDRATVRATIRDALLRLRAGCVNAD